MKAGVQIVVFADVDQTFPAFVASEPSFGVAATLDREGIALVLCSSMTRAEIEACQQDLDIAHPFICESGAAIIVPHSYFPFDVPSERHLPGYDVVEFGRPHAEVAALLRRTARRLNVPVLGFGDFAVDRVAAECCLSPAQAQRAKLREYDEPFRIVDDTPDHHERLWRGLRAAGLACTYCGYFEHVGAPVDKAESINVLSTLYRHASPTLVTASVERGAATWPVDGIRSWIDAVVATARRSRERSLRHVVSYER